ncbi:MAG: hypothetical protein AB3N23_14505 [Paracoccaceae bacterium]
MTASIKTIYLVVSLTGAAFSLSACDPNATGSVSTGVYYDSMIWNDYYYGYPRPPRPDRPRPEHPIARPPVAKPPIHRPPVARPLPARPGRLR